MRAFVTGASGFLGSYLLAKLVKKQEDAVAILVRPESDLSGIESVLSGAVLVRGDLRDLPDIEPTVAEFEPDTVIHLAWEGVLNTARNETSQTDNIHMSLELIKLAGRIGSKHWIGLGSQAEYGPHSARLDEEAATRPTTLYGAAKLSTCVTAGRLCEELGLRFAWLRVFSTYGPGNHPSWMIPYLILKLMNRERPALTAGEQVWDFLHGEDAAEAVYQVSSKPGADGIFNLGSGRGVRIREIVERIRDLIDPALPLGFGEIPYRPDQVMRLEADIRRLQTFTGWNPMISLDDGLARTVEWYDEYRSEYGHAQLR